MKITREKLRKMILESLISEGYEEMTGITPVGGGYSGFVPIVGKGIIKKDPTGETHQSEEGELAQHFKSPEFQNKMSWYYSDRAFGDDTKVFLHPLLGTVEGLNQKFTSMPGGLKGFIQERVNIVNLSEPWIDNFILNDLKLSNDQKEKIDKTSDLLLLPITSGLTRGIFRVSPHMIMHAFFDASSHPMVDKLRLIWAGGPFETKPKAGENYGDTKSSPEPAGFGPAFADLQKHLRQLLTLKGSSKGQMTGGDWLAEALTQEILQYPNRGAIGNVDGRGFGMDPEAFSKISKEMQDFLLYTMAPGIRFVAKVVREQLRGKAVFINLV